MQACDRMVSCGVSYTESCRGLSLSVKELSGHFEQNKVVSVGTCVYACVHVVDLVVEDRPLEFSCVCVCER